MLSVAQVFEMQAGDDQEAAWINPGFEAVVANIKSTQTKAGKPMHICTLRDTVGSAEISMTVWSKAPGFTEGDRIEVYGKGLRRTEYNGLDQVTLGKETEVHVLGKAVVHDGQPPLRGGDTQERAPAGTGKDFHLQMKKIGLLYCHAVRYAKRANDNLGNNFTPEQMQAAIASIFIQSCHRNLLDIVTPLEWTDKPVQEQARAQDDRRLANPKELDEDVPF